MLAGANGVLLCRQTKGIPAHGMKHIETAKAFVSGNDVCGGITFGMTDMQPRSARIRKHVEDVKLWFGRIESRFAGIWSVKGVLLFPDALPFRLELVEWKGFAALA